MDPRVPILLLLLLGAGLIGWGLAKRRTGARHGAGEALDADAYARAGREQGNPLIVVGAALVAITLIVWMVAK